MSTGRDTLSAEVKIALRAATDEAIERETKTLEPDQRQRVRKERALPQLVSPHAWAETLVRQTLPSGKLGEALGYLLTQ